LRKLKLTDMFVSAAIVLLTCVVYSATIYNSDWGTVADFISAFGAGFAGRVTVSWGLLPIYQSIRLRTRSAPGANATGEATPASSG
jgi:hypothetical protein